MPPPRNTPPKPPHRPASRPVRPPRASRVVYVKQDSQWFWKAALFLLLVGIGVGGWYFYHHQPEETPPVVARQEEPPPPQDPVKLPEIVTKPEVDGPRVPPPDRPVQPEPPPPPRPPDKVFGEGVIAVVKPVVNDTPSDIDRAAWRIRPTAKKPMQVPRDNITQMDRIISAIDDYEGIPVERTVAHPTARDFPGSVPDVIPRVNYIYLLKPNSPEGWRTTALYAPPGEILTVRLNERHTHSGLTLRIGCHTDDILRSKRPTWHRFPRIVRSFRLDKEEVKVANPFGGPIYITSPARLDFSEDDLGLPIQIIGAVQAPYYELGVTTREEWAKSKNEHRAPWAELACKGIILSVPREQIRNLTNPEPLMKVWQRIVDEQDWLAGITNRTRPERIVPDRDISIGWMHSGYPIMCYLASAPGMTDMNYLTKRGDWGFYHELGHNRQSGAWTFKGYGEVTNNLFSLLCMERISGQKPWDRFNRKEVNESLAGLMSTPRISGPFELLAQYIPVIQTFGWEPLRETFLSYRTDRFSGSDDNEKKAEFVTRWSLQCKANLAPYFEKLGFPYTEEMKTRLKDLKEWKPPGFPPRGIKHTGKTRKISDNESHAENND